MIIQTPAQKYYKDHDSTTVNMKSEINGDTLKEKETEAANEK